MNSHRRGPRFLPADLLFLAMTAIYAWLCLRGIVDISAGGAILDSDLQTYAQGMAGAAHPELFAADPVLNSFTEANSIPNLQRMLAVRLAPPDSPQIGLLRTGPVVIFLFYAGWYAFGRWLFSYPAWAATLALLSGVTVWVGWGTFWGITHSDPVPRVFFAACLPWLLMLAICAIHKPWLRPAAMFCAGCGMWIHGVNALNCGAMIFMAFLLLKPHGATLKSHLGNCAICLLLFFTPALIFLWPSLSQGQSFSQNDLAIFTELFHMRWQKDYSNFWPRLAAFFSPASDGLPILALGALGWLVALIKGSPRIKTLCRMYPPFLLALALVTIFCWAETRYAPQLGRVPMGHELARGLRYLVPLSWLMVVAALASLCGSLTRRLLLCALIACVLLFTKDRQYEAAQYALSQYTGLDLPLAEKAAAEKVYAQKYRDLMLAIKKIVPAGEPVFSDSDDMAIRYLANRPLVHAFKDGYVFFYNKDAQGSRQWLEYEKTRRSDPRGLMRAWVKSNAPWILLRDKNRWLLGDDARVVYDENGWILAKRISIQRPGMGEQAAVMRCRDQFPPV